MNSTYSIYMRDARGNLLTVFNNFDRLEYARGAGQSGYFYLDINPDKLDPTLISLDNRFEVWRSVGGLAPYLDGETIFFLRRWGWASGQDGSEIFRLYGRDPLYLLEGRNVAYYAGDTTYTQLSAVAADDGMKSIINSNLGSTATDTTRDLSTYLTVDVSTGAAPAANIAFSRRQIINVLQDLSAASWAAGTYLTFDIVYSGPSTLAFKTYTGQRGFDHGGSSDTRVTISEKARNLLNGAVYEDHENEFNSIYAGGQGTEADRIVENSKDQASINFSPFNLREKFIPDLTDTTTAAVQMAADAGLYQNKAFTILTGQIIDNNGGVIDGIHFRYGDIVYAEKRGIGVDSHIDAMHVTVYRGQETRENYIKGLK